MKYYRMQPEVVDVRDIDEMMPKGVTNPIGCCLLDGTEVVVKYPNNPFGSGVLVNEIIGACVADLMGVSIPEYGLCYLSEEVISSSDIYGPFGEGIDESNAGKCFYSRRYTNTTTVQKYIRNSERPDGLLIVLYDFVLNNCDRHEGNLLQVIGTDKLVCIDNSHIIEDKNDVSGKLKKYLEKEKLMSIDYFINDIDFYRGFLKGYGLDDMICLSEEIMNNISERDLLEIKQLIPREWQDSVGERSINVKLEIISRRLHTLSDACKKIMEVANE